MKFSKAESAESYLVESKILPRNFDGSFKYERVSLKKIYIKEMSLFGQIIVRDITPSEQISLLKSKNHLRGSAMIAGGEDLR